MASGSRIAIVTDSTASLPATLAERRDVTVVPLHVVVGDDVRTEGVDVDGEAIAAAMRAGTSVGTSRAAPEAMARVYADLAAEGAEEIVAVHLSAEVSGTFESACLAARESAVPVRCLDSRHVGMATGYAVLDAADARDAGADVDAIVAAAERRAAAASVLFYVDTLEHLRRGGRVTAASALLGTALAVKPLLGVRDGRIVPLEKVRTAQRAIARLEAIAVEHARAATGTVDLAVQHLADRPRAAEVADRLAERLSAGGVDLGDVAVAEVGGVIGAHVGPGLLAVEHALAATGTVDLAVQHLADRPRAAEVADRLAERLTAGGVALGDVAVAEVGGVIGAHVGPGLLAVTVAPR